MEELGAPTPPLANTAPSAPEEGSWWTRLKAQASEAAAAVAPALEQAAALASEKAAQAAALASEKAAQVSAQGSVLASEAAARASSLAAEAAAGASRLAEELSKPETRAELSARCAAPAWHSALADSRPARPFLSSLGAELGGRLRKLRAMLPGEADASLGITADLRQFVASLDADVVAEAAGSLPAEPPALTAWQQAHAAAVLAAVPAAAALHASLVPARLSEASWWQAYFRLTRGLLAELQEDSRAALPAALGTAPAGLGAPAAESPKPQQQEAVAAVIAVSAAVVAAPAALASAAVEAPKPALPVVTPPPPPAPPPPPPTTQQPASAPADDDLESYLATELEAGADDEPEADADDSLEAEFEALLD